MSSIVKSTLAITIDIYGAFQEWNVSVAQAQWHIRCVIFHLRIITNLPPSRKSVNVINVRFFWVFSSLPSWICSTFLSVSRSNLHWLDPCGSSKHRKFPYLWRFVQEREHQEWKRREKKETKRRPLFSHRNVSARIFRIYLILDTLTLWHHFFFVRFI